VDSNKLSNLLGLERHATVLGIGFGFFFVRNEISNWFHLFIDEASLSRKLAAMVWRLGTVSVHG
jgi:hypothetical protein